MKNVTVIGAGTMGNGIAHVFAQNGFTVSLVDVNAAQLEKALATITKNFDRQIAKGAVSEEQKQQALINLTTSTDIVTGVKDAGLVIEAATENIDLKLKIFKQIDEATPAGAILASNTSSISITKIAAVTKRPELVIGMHFMNPVPVMKLVEIINGYATKREVTEQIVELSKQLGKTPCVVKDYPGFIANRILMPMINEAVYSLYEGIAGVEEIDTIMKLGMAHPMGPLQLADFTPNLPAATIFINKGHGAYFVLPNPLYNTFKILRQTSKPIKSANCKGPIGCAIPNFIMVSISSTPAMPSYRL